MKKHILIIIMVFPFLIMGQIGQNKIPKKAPKYFNQNFKVSEANEIYMGRVKIEEFYWEDKMRINTENKYE